MRAFVLMGSPLHSLHVAFMYRPGRDVMFLLAFDALAARRFVGGRAASFDPIGAGPRGHPNTFPGVGRHEGLRLRFELSAATVAAEIKLSSCRFRAELGVPARRHSTNRISFHLKIAFHGKSFRR